MLRSSLTRLAGDGLALTAHDCFAHLAVTGAHERYGDTAVVLIGPDPRAAARSHSPQTRADRASGFAESTAGSADRRMARLPMQSRFDVFGAVPSVCSSEA
jgi:hypothetical protein